MIIDVNKEDIFKSNAKHITFAVNTEGLNDFGFASSVITHGWDDLSKSIKRCQARNSN